jgi:ribonuclease BN (tRNA processing enzyme)
VRVAIVLLLGLLLAACPRGKSRPGKKASGPGETARDAAVRAGSAVREFEPGHDIRVERPDGAFVVLLGTGTPNPDPDRSGPSVAVVAGGTAYLVDFGPGVVRRAAAAQERGIEELRVEDIHTAFVTHLHSDHTAGYPDLILTPWVLGRKKPLEVYGPPGIASMTKHILKAYKEDIELRLRAEPGKKDGWKVVAHEIDPGPVYEDDNVKVEAFAVKHGAWKHAYGFRFETADRSIVISGDTRPVESIVESCGGCDVLVHEVYALEGFRVRPEDWQAYHKSFHTSSLELARIASEAEPGLLVLYHQLLWGATPEKLLEEIGRGYEGKVVYGTDLDVF